MGIFTCDKRKLNWACCDWHMGDPTSFRLTVFKVIEIRGGLYGQKMEILKLVLEL
jgi:hypothetical protein